MEKAITRSRIMDPGPVSRDLRIPVMRPCRRQYYQVLLLISIGTVLVYMYWYCRSIAQVHACERPTGYIKYESLFRMTLNPTHESIPLDSMCAT